MLTFIAPAKINLGLDVLGRRPDGFHDVKTVFQAVAPNDILEVELARDGGADRIEVSGPFAAGVPTTKDNIVIMALDRLRTALGKRGGFPGIAIKLTKEIPHGTGLGGGSSDGAAALVAANLLWGYPADDILLSRVASEVGSDCAFFLRGATALGTGRGERLTSLGCRRRLEVVIVIPEFRVSTREAYAALNPTDFGERSNIMGLTRWLSRHTDEPPKLENAFERAIGGKHPEIGQIIAAIRETGARVARMSGSGAACFGVFDDVEGATRASESLKERGWDVRLAHGVAHGARPLGTL